MQKRIVIILLAALLVAATGVFTGCSGGSQESVQAPAEQQATTAPAATETPAATENKKESSMSGDYAFGGSTTVDPIITAAIEEWKGIYPDVHISYEGVGSSTGIKGVIAGTYSLGAASREPKDSEKSQGVIAVPVALDAIAAVVNSDTVSVSNLSTEQLAAIYAGEITNWKEVGGPDASIVVFNRDEASGTFETFEVKVMGDKAFDKSASVTTGNGDMAAKVGATPYSIGYVGLGFIGEKGLKVLSLNGVKASIDNVYNGSYAVQRNLNVVHVGTLGGVEKAFVDYLLSSDGQDIVADLDFIPLPTESASVTVDYSGDYAFGGSTTVDPIITAAIEEWKGIYPDVHISYEGVGSSTGIKGVIAGTYSLGAASREPKDSEKSQGVIAVPVALDAIAAVVNSRSVTISNLSTEQLAAIYAGEITNWKEVGGPDASIVVFNRDEASGTFETFEVKVMGDKAFDKRASVTTGNGDMAAKVGATPFAIGYVGLGFIGEKGLRVLSLNGVEASIDNVYNGSYAVQRNLNVVHVGTLGGVEKAFVDYLLSSDGQDIVADLDFIPLP